MTSVELVCDVIYPRLSLDTRLFFSPIAKSLAGYEAKLCTCIRHHKEGAEGSQVNVTMTFLERAQDLAEV